MKIKLGVYEPQMHLSQNGRRWDWGLQWWEERAGGSQSSCDAGCDAHAGTQGDTGTPAVHTQCDRDTEAGVGITRMGGSSGMGWEWDGGR